MEIKYFPDTDSLLINFTDKEIVDTRDLNENILIELDKDGGLVSICLAGRLGLCSYPGKTEAEHRQDCLFDNSISC